MAKTADKVIEIALNEVGYLEKKSNSQLDNKTANAGENNYTKYARDLDNLGFFYNGKKNGYAWCDVFVDWVFVKAFGSKEGMNMLCQPEKSYGAGCKYSKNYYNGKRQFYKKDPLPGDQIFFYNSSKTSIAHTGLVYKVDENYVYTIEGNTSDSSGVIANGGGVFKKKYKLTYYRICGYGRPKYDTDSTESKPETQSETPEQNTPKPIAIKKAKDPARNYLAPLSGSYVVTPSVGLNIRNGAGASKTKMIAIPKGTVVKCYGYYTSNLGVKWLYVQFVYKNVQYTGFASSQYLKKK